MQSSPYSSTVHTNSVPTQPSNNILIPLSTFRTLPIDVQRDYARLHDLRDVGRLTTNDICSALFENTEWLHTQNIAGQLRLETSGGVVVAGDVMDLVEWHIEHLSDTPLLNNRLPSPDDTCVKPRLQHSNTAITQDRNIDIQGYQYLHRMTEDLQRAKTRLRAAIQQSQKAAREVCADVCLLQHQLDAENGRQAVLLETMTGIVGADAVDRINDQAWIVENEDRLAETGKKRQRPTSFYHVVPGKPSNGVKRRRLVDPASQVSTSRPRTILNYSTDDEETDDAYSDSNGSERDFVDDSYIYHDSRGHSPDEALEEWNWERESPDEESNSDTSEYQANLPWGSTDDSNHDSSDPDYEPPPWDLEDIWEIEHPRTDTKVRKMNPLHLDNFGDELNDCRGFLSDAGLSTDDPEDGYHDPAIVQRPSKSSFLNDKKNFPQSLGPLLKYVKYADPNLIAFGSRDIDEEQREAIKQSEIWQNKHTQWLHVKAQLAHNLFSPLDLEHRLAVLLESGHHHFYFDNEEWRRFEDH